MSTPSVFMMASLLMAAVAFAESTTAPATSTPISAYNGRYYGKMPPYQIFMIVIGAFAVLLAGTVLVLKRRRSSDADYNPMDAQ